MKLYLDQMFRVELAQALQAAGHDVLRASEAGQSRADDSEILTEAQARGRLLATLDSDFGDWTILPLKEHLCAIRPRVPQTGTKQAAAVLLPLLEGRQQEDFRSHLVIASARRARWVRTG